MAKKKKRHQAPITGLPEKFEDRLEKLFPDESIYTQVRNTFIERPTTFRVNTLKSSVLEVQQELKKHNIHTKPVTWSDIAFELTSSTKKKLMELLAYQEGHIYIQSFASQLPPLFLDVQPDQTVLDLTAAPGSKTSQIAALMNNTGTLIANEVNKVRFFKLQHNLENLGVTNTQTILSDGSRLLSNPKYLNHFDRILLDAPCSAESRFIIGNPRTLGYWSTHKIKEMANKQRRLLYSAFRALKKDGVLVYSTCTLAPEENELLIQKFLSKNPSAQLSPITLPGITKLNIISEWRNKTIEPEILKNTLRIKPTPNTESFFIAKITKTQDTIPV